MKGTKLWQDTGSPLISGRSGRQGPTWRSWLTAAVSALVISVAFVWLVLGAPPAQPTVTTAIAVGVLTLGSTAGSGLGVMLARGRGWRVGWLACVALGVVGAVLLYLLFA